MGILPFLEIGHTFVIAEAGVNHNGRLDLALSLVDVAAECNADAVKFQTFKAEGVVTREAVKAEYQIKTTGSDGDQLEMLKALEVPEEWYPHILKRCQEVGIMFLSTPHDWEAIDILEAFDVAAFKVGSGDLTNLPFLRKLASKGRPIILSTGMGTLSDVEDAVETIRGAGNEDLAILHCVTSYPARVEDVNLLAMRTIGQAFGVVVGYSDHTVGVEAGLAATALGAQIIEKHFTLDKQMTGPDHQASLDPVELKTFIEGVRLVEQALGDGIKQPVPVEFEIEVVARKSIVAGIDIPKGTIVTENMLTTKRPGNGIKPKYWYDIVGKPTICHINKDDLLQWSHIDWT